LDGKGGGLACGAAGKEHLNQRLQPAAGGPVERFVLPFSWCPDLQYCFMSRRRHRGCGGWGASTVAFMLKRLAYIPAWIQLLNT